MRLLCLICVSLSGVIAGAAESSQVQLEAALASSARGDCAAAVPQLEAVLRRDPTVAAAINGLAVCEARMGHHDRAASGFARLTKLQPQAWQAWNNLGVSYLAAGEPRQAIPALRRATELSPQSTNPWYQLGSAFTMLHEQESAYSAFDAAQKLSPADPQITKAWLDSAAALGTSAADQIERHEYQKAATTLRLIRRPLENSASWNNLLGYAEFKLNQPQPALQHLQKALSLDPANEDYLLDLGEFLGTHGAAQSAVDLFQVAVKRMPDSKRARFGLAVSWILLERREEAIRLLETLLREDERFEPAYTALGECYEDAGNQAALVELGTKLQRVNPRNPVGWYLAGAGQLQLATQGEREHLEPAVQAFDRGLALAPGWARLHFARAKAWQEQNNPQQALRELQETVRLEPDHERAHYQLARLYQKLGNATLAKQEFAIHSRLKSETRTAQYQRLIIGSRSQ